MSICMFFSEINGKLIIINIAKQTEKIKVFEGKKQKECLIWGAFLYFCILNHIWFTYLFLVSSWIIGIFLFLNYITIINQYDSGILTLNLDNFIEILCMAYLWKQWGYL